MIYNETHKSRAIFFLKKLIIMINNLSNIFRIQKKSRAFLDIVAKTRKRDGRLFLKRLKEEEAD